MTTILSGASGAPAYSHAVNFDALQSRFDILIDELSTQPFSASALSDALVGGVNEALQSCVPFLSRREGCLSVASESLLVSILILSFWRIICGYRLPRPPLNSSRKTIQSISGL